MQKRKKILSLVFKILIGVGSFVIIYMRLRTDFTPEKLSLLSQAAFSPRGLLVLTLCLLLIPVNWGIESYKWQIITRPIQPINYRTATKSVYSGVCLGNLAPGRATEFLAKIIFFKIENRPQVTILHFIGGMIQLSVTIIAGFIALLLTLRNFSGSESWMTYTTIAVGAVLLALLAFSIWRIDYILHIISTKIRKGTNIVSFHYKFSPGALIRLFGFSALRYIVFFTQFLLLLYLFSPGISIPVILPGIALYYLITTTLPMISVLEAAIRAAVALVVFKDSGMGNSALATSSVLIWMINIIVPSLLGYYFLLRQNFNFRLFKKQK